MCNTHKNVIKKHSDVIENSKISVPISNKLFPPPPFSFSLSLALSLSLPHISQGVTIQGGNPWNVAIITKPDLEAVAYVHDIPNSSEPSVCTAPQTYTHMHLYCIKLRIQITVTEFDKNQHVY